MVVCYNISLSFGCKRKKKKRNRKLSLLDQSVSVVVRGGSKFVCLCECASECQCVHLSLWFPVYSRRSGKKKKKPKKEKKNRKSFLSPCTRQWRKQ